MHSVENEGTPGASIESAGDLSNESQSAADARKERIAAFARAFERVDALDNNENLRKIEDISSEKSWLGEEWADEVAVPLEQLVEQVHDLIREIRSLAELGGPACELDLSNGAISMSPALSRLRQMTRLLAYDACVRGKECNYSEAIGDILASLKLADIVRDQPTLFSQLTAMSIEAVSCGTAELALPEAGLPSDLASKLTQCTGGADLRGKFADSLLGDCLMALEAFEKVPEGLTCEQLTGGRSSVMIDLALRLYGSRFARPWLNMDEEAYVDTIQRIAEIARHPYYETLPLMHDMEQVAEGLSLTKPMSLWMLNIMIPSYTRSIESQAHFEAALDLMRIGISVEQYRASTGSYPATLDAIASSIGGTVPVDPFTGQPYRYQPSSASFLLYSVGPNLTDDGGTVDRRAGDIVWRGQEKEKD
jgi:hypothetical protein